jgi:hypothetical protein
VVINGEYVREHLVKAQRPDMKRYIL